MMRCRRIVTAIGILILIVGAVCYQVFQSDSSRWRYTASLPFPLSYTSAIVLPNGQVLVAGGSHLDSGDASTNCVLFDPKSETWKLTNSLPAPSEVYLLDKSNIVTLGRRVGLFSGRNCFIYSTNSEKWTTSTVTDTANSASFVQVPADQILVHTYGYSDVELVDLRALVAHHIFHIPSPGKVVSSTILLPKNRVLVFPKDAEACLYDPMTNSVENIPDPPIGTVEDAILLPNGEIFCSLSLNPVSGSSSTPRSGGYYPRGVEALFDPDTKSWSPLTDPDAALRQTLTLLPSGRLLLTGGHNTFKGGFFTQVLGDYIRPMLGGNAFDAEGIEYAKCRIFDPSTKTFRTTCPLKEPLLDHSVVVLSDQRVLVIGGDLISRCEIIDLHLLDP